MTYIIQHEPLIKRRCRCGYFFLTPEAHPILLCPDCIEFAAQDEPCRSRRKYETEEERFRAYYQKHRKQILARKREQRFARLEAIKTAAADEGGESRFRSQRDDPAAVAVI